ncbi:Rieske 2Fe-2S domain-containing protein [Thalassotalea marina]|uniref:Rieske domain-containing protein n=1 Tax=Thalassotalea marina TaxID=1673741 RepID=A0A919BJ75_9GAMM|nr:Rieske 2Fe-2S domain-containing protein [Thalassotalea marina]GHF93664.1 hypothetical protein GCM10017161_22710 [Thalassotalea marina]
MIIKQYFSAGGRISAEQQVMQIQDTNQNNVWRGRAILPPANLEKDILIYQATTEQGETKYRAVPAKCPHQGVDLVDDVLKEDGNVYCHLHKRPICIFSEYNFGFDVVKRDEQFYLIKSE